MPQERRSNPESLQLFREACAWLKENGSPGIESFPVFELDQQAEKVLTPEAITSSKDKGWTVHLIDELQPDFAPYAEIAKENGFTVFESFVAGEGTKNHWLLIKRST